MSLTDKENPAVTTFRKYLQIKTEQPNVNYDECVEFLQAQAKSLELPSDVFYMAPKKPIVVISLVGKNPELPSLLLLSHMDVVPAETKKWTHDPFSADKDEKGNIYARGTQDMKSVGIQYLEAIRRFLNEKLTFDRTIHACFTPDEETGGILGMAKFVDTNEFRSLNVGFALDEGIACTDDVIPLFYAERSVWQFYIRSTGPTGHGSIMFDNTAAEKLMYVVNKILEWRTTEKLKLSQGMELGDVTSVNLTLLEGGRHVNVVPSELSAAFDVRLSVDVDHDAIEDTIKEWCHEAGDGVRLDVIKKNKKTVPTKLDDSNPWWLKFKSECDKIGLKLQPAVCPGAGDSRYVRQNGIPALGFSPMMYTPLLLHDHDEYLNENTFLNGITIYYNIIKSLATK